MSSAGDGSTRDRILALLCSGEGTAGELADALGISANAARAHLARLEAEGLATYRVMREGVGKPAHAYSVTALGSARLSRAYLPLLSALLAEMGRTAGPEEKEALLRGAGAALGRQQPKPQGALLDRAEAALGLLGELGGRGTLRQEGDTLWIEGTCCPLRALVPEEPLVCKAVEAMLSEVVGAPVRDHCQKGDPPSCRLAIDVLSR